MKSYITILSLLFINITALALSPIDYGLLDAESDFERFDILYETHVKAIEMGEEVDYSNIGELTIAIPSYAKSIPLGVVTDFKELKLFVTNNTKDFFLFELVGSCEYVDINSDAEVYDNFVNKKGKQLLILEDSEPWIEERIGYSYPVYRKDLILIEDGKVKNSPIFPYNEIFNTKFYICQSSNNKKSIKGLAIFRSHDSTKMTFPFFINYQNNVELKSIYLNTPESSLYGDSAIMLRNCANVILEDIVIDGTYSMKDKFGYGISLNNVYNITIKNLHAFCLWGVFGNNNVNKVKIKNSQLNRFDIHCYGKDILMRNCTFTNMYNQYSSINGEVRHVKCRFVNSIPCLIEPSYNSYTSFKLIFNKCQFVMEELNNTIVSFYMMPIERNSRPELYKRELPAIFLRNSEIVANTLPHIYLYKCNNIRNESISVDSDPIYIVKELTMSKTSTLKVSNFEVNNKH